MSLWIINTLLFFSVIILAIFTTVFAFTIIAAKEIDEVKGLNVAYAMMSVYKVGLGLAVVFSLIGVCVLFYYCVECHVKACYKDVVKQKRKARVVAQESNESSSSSSD